LYRGGGEREGSRTSLLAEPREVALRPQGSHAHVLYTTDRGEATSAFSLSSAASRGPAHGRPADSHSGTSRRKLPSRPQWAIRRDPVRTNSGGRAAGDDVAARARNGDPAGPSRRSLPVERPQLEPTGNRSRAQFIRRSAPALPFKGQAKERPGTSRPTF